MKDVGGRFSTEPCSEIHNKTHLPYALLGMTDGFHLHLPS